jgi:hypothetical protein
VPGKVRLQHLPSPGRTGLATAAHVADHAFDEGGMVAVPEGSAREYRIARIWYHPGIVRRLDEGLYARSDRADDGEVANRVPDVAVIQLSSDGHNCPAKNPLFSSSRET